MEETGTTLLENNDEQSKAVAAVEDNKSQGHPVIDIEAFMAVDLRVAEVLAAEAVPKSKKLIKLTVNIGAEYGERQILSGIAQWFTPEQLVGKRLVVVANLKPARLMGLESQGMILAVEDPDKGTLNVMEVAEEFEIGTKIR